MNHTRSKIFLIALGFSTALAACESKDGRPRDALRPAATGIEDAKRGTSVPSNQQPDPKPRWSSRCSTTKGTFSIEFNSPSGDVTEDDMTAAIRWSDGSSLPINVKPAWFTPLLNASSDIENVCTATVGHAFPDGRVLLWFSRNDRPNGDQLQLLLLDLAARRILDLHSDIGEVTESPTIIKTASGFSVLLLKEWRQVPGDGEFGVPDWKDLVIKKDRISEAWRGEKDHAKSSGERPPNTPLQPAAERRGG